MWTFHVLMLSVLTAASPFINDLECQKISTCHHDNCFRDICHRSLYKERSTDCVKYFQTQVTVTSGGGTVYTTVTERTTPTVTSFVTYTTPIPGSTTTVAEETETELITVTEVTTSEIVAPTTYISVLRVQHRQNQLDLPDYIVSHCKPENGRNPTQRWSSACSCIGVTASTSTITQAGTTVTSTTTSTADAETTTETASTESVITIVTTIEVTTTAATVSSTVTTTTTGTSVAPGPSATYSHVATFRDWCIPNGFQSEDVSFPAASYDQAFQLCAAKCDASPSCLQIWVGYSSSGSSFSCNTGSGRRYQWTGWDESFLQCRLSPPFKRFGDWYSKQ